MDPKCGSQQFCRSCHCRTTRQKYIRRFPQWSRAICPEPSTETNGVSRFWWLRARKIWFGFRAHVGYSPAPANENPKMKILNVVFDKYIMSIVMKANRLVVNWAA